MLCVTSPMMHGPEVLDLQTKLASLHYSVSKIDGWFGRETERALRAFQRASGLRVDGMFGPASKTALEAALLADAPNAGHPDEPGRAALAAVEEARRHLGVRGDSVGWEPFAAWLGLKREWYLPPSKPLRWCNIFVSFCFKEGAGYEICKGSKGSGVFPGKGCSYVPTTEAWLKHEGLWVGKGVPPLPGDIVIFPGHIGIVEKVGADFATAGFHTIEGNYSNSVQRPRRHLHEIVGFGRIDD